MLVPSLEHFFTRVTSRISQIGSTLQQTTSNKNLFFNGYIIGTALGLVWTPCAGPILATITALASTHGITLTTLFMIIAYSSGAAAPMLFIMYGGNKILHTTQILTPYTSLIKRISGIVIILTALTMVFNLDTQFQSLIASYFPTLSIESHPFIIKELKNLKSDGYHMDNQTKAPELVGITHWINSKPLSLNDLKGKVVLIDFWTYSCINCIRTLPHIKEWYSTYKNKGLEIIGVHTPEFAFEKNNSHVDAAVKKFCITYPIALDNNYATWQAYDNHYWPAHYLINQEGIIVYHHLGEGNYQETENKIRQLLSLKPLGKTETEELQTMITPETYLGCSRSDRYHQDITLHKDHIINYHYKAPLPINHVGLTGSWLSKNDCIISSDSNCTIDLNFTAHTVYLVMESLTPQEIIILLDGKPLSKNSYTSDTNQNGNIVVHEPRMYEIVNLGKKYGKHLLTLKFPSHITVYVFTFG
jgi:thiol-disulfide isomerase/thioredoxin